MTMAFSFWGEGEMGEQGSGREQSMGFLSPVWTTCSPGAKVRSRISKSSVRMGLVATRKITSLPHMLLEADHLDVDQRKELRRAFLYARKRCTEDTTALDRAVAISSIVSGMRSHVDAMIMTLLTHLNLSEEEIGISFNQEVARMVIEAKKLRDLPLLLDVTQDVEEQLEAMKGLILSIVNDAEVLLYILAERLHTLREMRNSDLEQDERRQLSTVTWAVHAPLAGMLGANRLKTELENLAFYIYDKDSYSELERQVASVVKKREARVQTAIAILKRHLDRGRLACEISGREKHLYSIYKKMVRDEKSLEDIFDLTALRVIVASEGERAVGECYRVFGIVHRVWTPVPNRFKDYIAAPKPNGYESVHTTVLDDRNEPLEVQIRSRHMHDKSEFGLAAHWAYKEGVTDEGKISQQEIFRERIQSRPWERKEVAPEASRVYCFTPKGRILSFVRGATPLDFAYAVHTEVGHNYGGALVNGEIVSASYELQPADEIEILKAPSKGPRKHWLKYARTSGARKKIRSELQALGVMVPQPAEKTKRKPPKIAPAVVTTEESDKPAVRTNKESHKPLVKKARESVLLGGLEVAVQFAKCCHPFAGDDIAGFVTRGRGLTIHCSNCVILNGLDTRRIVRDVSWSTEGTNQSRAVDVEVEGEENSPLVQKILAMGGRLRKTLPALKTSHRNGKYPTPSPSSSAPSSTSSRLRFTANVKSRDEALQFVDRIREMAIVLSVSGL